MGSMKKSDRLQQQRILMGKIIATLFPDMTTDPGRIPDDRTVTAVRMAYGAAEAIADTIAGEIAVEVERNSRNARLPRVDVLPRAHLLAAVRAYAEQRGKDGDTSPLTLHSRKWKVGIVRHIRDGIRATDGQYVQKPRPTIKRWSQISSRLPDLDMTDQAILEWIEEYESR